MATKPSLSPVKGMREFYPEQLALRNYIYSRGIRSSMYNTKINLACINSSFAHLVLKEQGKCS